MSSSISEIPICNIGLLGQSVRYFWLSPLDALLERFPILELPHKQVFYSIILIESAQGEIVIDDDKIRLDEPKLIVVKPQLISSIDINRRAKGTMICFTEDFFSLRYNNNVLYQFLFLRPQSKPYVRLSSTQKSKWDILLQLITQEYITFTKKK